MEADIGMVDPAMLTEETGGSERPYDDPSPIMGSHSVLLDPPLTDLWPFAIQIFSL